MQTGFYSNTGAMVTQFNRLDIVSNNLANVNTSGYKKDDVVIGDFLRLYKEKRDLLPIDNHTKDASKFLNRSIVRVPQIVERYTNQETGAFEETSNPLDLALKQEGLFFVVQTPSGIKYTRKGNFLLNEKGEIAMQEGDLVLNRQNNPIKIQQGYNIDIASDGNIYAKNGENLQENQSIGDIKVVRFENTKYLKKIGDNYFETNKPEILMNGNNLIVQGYIEKSNVNAIREMTSLIEINRLTGMHQKVMDTQMNELNSDAISKLATIRV